MVSSILKQASEIMRKRKENKRWYQAVLCLAVVVAAVTTFALMHTGQAMTHKEKVLDCQYEVHEHDDDCYDSEGNLICGYADYVIHEHNDDCYNTEGELVCELPEIKLHEHDEEACYEEVLVCKEGTENAKNEESAETAGTSEEKAADEGNSGHKHTDACYDGGRELVCEKEEHTHDDGCYNETMTCEESEHTHDDDCYNDDGELTCDKDEHEHGDGCYDKELTCDIEEHEHTDGCYKSAGELVCGMEEGETADDGAAQAQGAEEAGEETAQSEAQSGEQDASAEPETDGTESDGAESDGAEEADATDESGETAGHVHTEECYEKVLKCEELTELHTHDDDCYEIIYDEETQEEIGRVLICEIPQLEEHVHTKDCFKIVETQGDHTHTEECYDEEGNLICGWEEEPIETYVRTYEGDGFTVTAEYTSEAKIPEEAEFRVEQIAADSDHYAKREAEYREKLESETAEMWALLNIGFYMDDEEIQPESPVTLTIQMLDEKGMPDGSPITIVHFAEDGAEVLDGSRVENRSTTFKLESFSEIAIGCRPTSDGAIYISQSFRYETDAFRMTFKVQGEAVPAEGEDALPEDAKDVISDEIRPVKSGITAPAEETKETEKTEPAEGEEEDNSEQIDGEVTDSEQEPAEGEEADSENKEDEEVKENDKKDDSENEEIKENPEAEPQQEDPEEETKEESKEAEAEEDSEKQEDAAENADSDKEETEGSEETDTEEDASAEEDSSEENPEEADTEEKEEEKEEKTDRLQFCLELADKNSGEYQAFVDYIGEDALKSDAHLMLQVMQYTLTYDDIELDVSECEITAEFLPTQKLVNYAEGSDSAPDDFEVSEEQRELEEEVGREVTIGIYQQSEDAQVEQVGEVFLGEEKELEDVEAPAIDSTKTDNDTTASAEDVQTLKLTAETIVVSDVLRAAAPEQETGEVTSGEDDEASDVPEKEEKTEKKQESKPAAAGVEPVVFELNTSSKVFAVRATGQPNPSFTVQYYANLDRVAYNNDDLKVTTSDSYTNELPVIDTSGKKMPGNGKGKDTSPNDNPIRKLYVDTRTGLLKVNKELTKVYEQRLFSYYKAPTINYMDALVENTNYTMAEIWILKSGRKADSVSKSDWNICTLSAESDWHFTNRWPGNLGALISNGTEYYNAETKETYVKTEAGYNIKGTSRNYIVISDEAVIRLVYNVSTGEPKISANFYDYDISDGYIYKQGTDGNNLSLSDRKNTSALTDETWYANTVKQGINNDNNYAGKSGVHLGFGNVNTGTRLGTNSWDGNTLNKYNNGTYQGCTFGLVTGLSGGILQYAPGIAAPNLFNEGGATTGKATYNNYSLKFNRQGDTYTLASVVGAGGYASNLEVFNNPVTANYPEKGKKAHTHWHIWTNNFWPMDSAPSWGTEGHDLKFGRNDIRGYDEDGEGNTNRRHALSDKTGNYTSYIFPASDDGLDHNSYFGMQYQVEFQLTPDYVGPLEYYFFGDDDMWVFLDNTLICDIGGVHSSVGEYVNLWDYLKDFQTHEHKAGECYDTSNPVCGKDHTHTESCYELNCGKHKLSFFYTERGASGSTCWMQFTLPSVSSATDGTIPDKDYGHLRIDKKVQDNKGNLIDPTGSRVVNKEEFEFTIELRDEGGNYLPDNYSYEKYNADGTLKGNNLVISSGGTFTLKNGEYIIIKYIPVGATYKIVEGDDVVKVSNWGTDQESTSVTEGDYIYETDIKVDGTSFKTDLPWDGREENEKKAEGIITEANESEVLYINKFYVFELPETGGLGVVYYAEAGILMVLLSITFCIVYRKQKSTGRGC